MKDRAILLVDDETDLLEIASIYFRTGRIYPDFNCCLRESRSENMEGSKAFYDNS